MSAATWGPELDGEARQKQSREIVTVGWDGASQPIRRYRDELHLPDHERAVPPRSRTFIVRLALEAEGLSVVYTDVPGQDADEAAAKAVKKAETECATEGFVLDGPVEEES
jgi:hypothetical protein